MLVLPVEAMLAGKPSRLKARNSRPVRVIIEEVAIETEVIIASPQSLHRRN